MRRSVTLLQSYTREDLFRRTGRQILTEEDYNDFISGGRVTDQEDGWDAMHQGYYGA